MKKKRNKTHTNRLQLASVWELCYGRWYLSVNRVGKRYLRSTGTQLSAVWQWRTTNRYRQQYVQKPKMNNSMTPNQPKLMRRHILNQPINLHK